MNDDIALQPSKYPEDIKNSTQYLKTVIIKLEQLVAEEMS